MIKYVTEKVTKTEKTPVAVICDVCKKEYNYDMKDGGTEAQEFQHIRIEGGYGSVFGDGNRRKADICQHCFLKIMGKYLMDDNGE